MYSNFTLVSAVVCAELFLLTSASYAQDEADTNLMTNVGFETRESFARSPVRNGWDYSMTARSDVTFTDNAYLTPQNRTSDFILSPGVSIEVEETGLRSSLNASIDVSYDFYKRSTDLDGPRVNALVDGTVQLIDDHIWLRARAATSLQASSPFGTRPATERSVGGNQVQILTYGISPLVRQSITPNIFAEVTYDLSGVAFLRAPTGRADVAANNSLMQKAEARLSNSEGSPNFEWTLASAYEENDIAHSSLSSSMRVRGEAIGKYHLTSVFALVATAGYEQIDEPTLDDQFTGAYGMGGVSWTPSPRMRLQLEGGYRYRDPHYKGELKYSPNQRLTITATYNQGVDTSQGALNNTVARIGRDAFGNLVDSVTGGPPHPHTSVFDFNDHAFKYSRLHIGVQGVSGRNFYDISGEYERRKINSASGESWSAQAKLGRHLTQSLSVSVEGRYAKSESPTLPKNTQLNAKTTLITPRIDYQLNDSVVSSLRYVYLEQSTTLVKYRENAAVLSLSIRF